MKYIKYMSPLQSREQLALSRRLRQAYPPLDIPVPLIILLAAIVTITLLSIR